MKISKQIKAFDMQEYEVLVNFAGYIGADETYTVFADSAENAEFEAIEMAKDDVGTIEETNIEDDEWEVVVGFAGFIGVEETYTVYADSREEAIDAALQEAWDDLSAEVVDSDDDSDDDEDEE